MMIKIDLHVHTSDHSLCSIMSAHEAIEAAIQNGLDGIVLTEHDFLWLERDLDCLSEKYANHIKVFPGIEISCREGHFLVYGFKNSEGIYYNMPAKKLIDVAHHNNAAIIAAHPYRYSKKEGDYCYHLDIDGVEIDSNNTHEIAHEQAIKLADTKKLFMVTSSDSHSTDAIGNYYTLFPDSVNTLYDIVDYILDFKIANNSA
ncbi:MAG: PHP domain-containing protein [bacterium]